MRFSSTSLLGDEGFQGARAVGTGAPRREIAATDVEIDELVYELYGITAEERKIIEGEQNRA